MSAMKGGGPQMKHFVSSNGRNLNASEQSLKLILPSVYEMALLWTQINQ